MTATERRLKKRALVSATLRSHKIGSFRQVAPGKHRSKCKQCDAQVTVIVNPMPNEIDVGGEMVALNCPVLHKRT